MSPMWPLIFFGIVCVAASDNCPGVTFVTREEWNSSIPNIKPNLLTPVNYIFIHHAAGEKCGNQASCSSHMREIQHYHIVHKGWDDIGYSFMIGGDGKVYIGRDWQRIGAHTYRYNHISYGISFMGTYTDHVPSDNMVQAAQKLIKCGVDQGYINKAYGLYGHRDVSCTESPGNAFYKTLSTWKNWHAFGPKHANC